MNIIIFEFYKQRTRLSDDTLRELKRIVDKEFNRRTIAETHSREMIMG